MNGRQAVRQHASDPNVLDARSEAIWSAYQSVRRRSLEICQPLAIEDYGVQIIAEASPPKWHLAHTAWFFETMLLKEYLPGYREYHPQYAILFNSYYDTLGGYHPRAERGALSRPTVAEIYDYRAYVDEHVYRLLQHVAGDDPVGSLRHDLFNRLVIGINHEQQHQELLLTDIKYHFAYNPLLPVYRELAVPVATKSPVLHYVELAGGLHHIGYQDDGFAFDNETPRHRVWLNDFRLASRPVSNGEYLEFIDAGGYTQAEFWMSDAWKIIQHQQWQAPLYWRRVDEAWHVMTLAGLRTLDIHAPVCHISFYEAAAFARWSGKRLPTEAEWERATQGLPIEGNFYEQDLLQPVAGFGEARLQQMFGDVWEWTSSPYVAYPGYCQAQGPLGEYNGKFMSSQMVLRGGSCATPIDHIRASYRNFFYPHERWQFSGLRLAEDA